MSLIYKICPEAMWREAEAAGEFRGSPVDLQDGFIHFSTAAQVAETAARHFAGQPDLLLIEVEGAGLGRRLRFEPSRGGDRFPHLYGPLPVAQVRRADPLPLGQDGRHIFPDLAERGSALGDDGRFDPAERGWKTRTEAGLAGLIGPIWTRAEGEGARYGLLADPKHLNVAGVVHGGVLMALADEALGRASWLANGRRPQVTIQLDTHFIGAARAGEFIEAECRIVRQTRSLLFMAATLQAGERVVATSNGVWKVLGA